MPFGIRWGFSSPAPLPTSSLYGLEGHYPRIRRAIRRMGEAYSLGKAAVVVRCGPAVGNVDGLYVLLDDDFEAAIEDPALPDGYRRRLADAWNACVMRTHPDEVAAVIVPSEGLARLHGDRGHKIIRMDPSWNVPASFPDPGFHASPMKVAFLGTRSHLGDLELLRPALTELGRTWEFHHFLGSGAPEWLLKCRQVIAHPAHPWKSYLRRIGTLRFHICVYPMRPTAVNAARSCNKVMEHAMTGAASLYGCHVPFARELSELDSRVLIDDDDWGYAISSLVSDRAECLLLAKSGHQFACKLAESAKARQMEIWRALARGDGLRV